MDKQKNLNIVHIFNMIYFMRYWCSKNIFLVFVLCFQIVIFFIFSKIENILVIFGYIFEWKKNFHINILSVFSFSLGDIFYSIIFLVLLYLVIKFIFSKQRKIYIKKLLVFINIFYFLYQILWGMLYFQRPIMENLSQNEIDSSELKLLAMKYLHLCKEERKKVNEDRDGIFQIENLDIIKQEIIKNQQKIPFFDKNPIVRTSVKPSLYAPYMGFSGILGYYNPFTAEAQYNPNLPNTYLPFTIAHEMAHQMGYAREQEANFVGYLLGVYSENADFRYSTYYFVLKSLLNSLYATDPNFVEDVLSQYSPEMKRDRAEELRFREQNESWMDDVFAFTNDIFLKYNQQEGSITYSYFLHLLIEYEKKIIFQNSLV